MDLPLLIIKLVIQNSIKETVYLGGVATKAASKRDHGIY